MRLIGERNTSSEIQYILLYSQQIIIVISWINQHFHIYSFKNHRNMMDIYVMIIYKTIKIYISCTYSIWNINVIAQTYFIWNVLLLFIQNNGLVSTYLTSNTLLKILEYYRLIWSEIYPFMFKRRYHIYIHAINNTFTHYWDIWCEIYYTWKRYWYGLLITLLICDK